MSGRKSWEVANVLKEVEKAQEEIIQNYQDSIKNNINEIEIIKEEVVNNDIDKKIEAIKDENLKKTFRNYKTFFNRAKTIENKLYSILTNRDKLIKRAAELREIIKNKTHYATNEYNEAVKIREQINNYKKELSDLKIESEKLKHQIVKLKSFIENVEDIFNARKEYVERIYDDIDSKLYEGAYTLVEDIAERKNTKVSKIEYYDHYKKENNFEKFERELENIQKLINNNKFDEAEQKLNKLNEEIIKISNEADKIKEDIESAFYLALKIRDIMLDKADFTKARIELIDGNPLNGFKVYTQNGDTINFDEIKVSDGEVKVNLDHIERAAGSCGIKWDSLKKIFNEEGIPITDVTKNGYSVIYNQGIKIKQDGKIKERGSK